MSSPTQRALAVRRWTACSRALKASGMSQRSTCAKVQDCSLRIPVREHDHARARVFECSERVVAVDAFDPQAGRRQQQLHFIAGEETQTHRVLDAAEASVRPDDVIEGVENEMLGGRMQAANNPPGNSSRDLVIFSRALQDRNAFRL